jgi:hypothetical protein
MGDHKNETGMLKKAAAAMLIFALCGPASFAEEIPASFGQRDLSFTAHNPLLGKYPIRHGFQGMPLDSGLVRKISDTCSDPGESDGIFRCAKKFSDGSTIQISTDQEHHGEEFKRQSVIAEFNARGEIMGRQSVRQKTAYQYLNDERKIRAEFFDIVNRPKNGKITREVIIYEYDLATGKAGKLSWTSYEQIGESDFAMITRHVALSYDSEGRPLMGRAEKWKDQVPVEQLFHWDRITDGIRSLDFNSWENWQNQIFNASPRQIFA